MLCEKHEIVNNKNLESKAAFTWGSEKNRTWEFLDFPQDASVTGLPDFVTKGDNRRKVTKVLHQRVN